MKQTTLLLSVLVVATAFAGCASNEGDGTQTATTPGATPTTATPTATPAAATPATTTPSTDGPPQPDPRCLAPPTGATNATGNSAATRLGMPELRFTTSDPTTEDPCFRFHGPQNATSGWNVFTLTYPQGGRTFHIMPMYFIGNHTQEELLQAFGPQGQPPEWAVPAGAVGGVTPGQTGSVAIDLEPGTYVYFCPIEGHMFKGMMGSLQVTQAVSEAVAPEADATITLVDYNFTVPELREGMDVIRVTNDGSEPHEAPLVKLANRANITRFIQAIEDPNATGPPPGVLVGGVNAIAPGQTVYLLVSLVADADYGFACFVSSPAHDGLPHIFVGPMLEDFTAHHAEGEGH